MASRPEPLPTFQLGAYPPFSWAARLLELKRTTLIAVLVMVAVARSGIGFYTGARAGDGQYDLLTISENMPKPTSHYKGVSVLSPMLARALGVSTPNGWIWLHVALVALLAVVTAVLLKSREEIEGDRLLLLGTSILASGAFVATARLIGHYDVWMIFGAVLIVLPRSVLPAIAGGVLMGLTNREQGLLAMVGLLCMAIATDRRYVKRAAIATVSILVSYLAISLWYGYYDVAMETRGKLLIPNLRQSILGFVVSFPVHVYAWYSAAWVVVLFALKRLPLKSRLWALAGVIAIPLAASMVTADGTRVFTSTGTAAFLLLLLSIPRSLFDSKAPALGNADLDRQSTEHPDPRMLLALTVGVMMMTPGLITWGRGAIISPWRDAVERLNSWIF